MTTPATAPLPDPVAAVAELKLGDQLLMLLGVSFVGILVAHYVFGLGKEPKNDRAA